MDQSKVQTQKEFVLSKGEAYVIRIFFSQVSLACDARDIVRWEHFGIPIDQTFDTSLPPSLLT